MDFSLLWAICVLKCANISLRQCGWEKWPPFCKRHFQMHIFNESSCIVLVQVMAWHRTCDKLLTNADPGYGRIHTALEIDDLTLGAKSLRHNSNTHCLCSTNLNLQAMDSICYNLPWVMIFFLSMKTFLYVLLNMYIISNSCIKYKGLNENIVYASTVR